MRNLTVCLTVSVIVAGCGGGSSPQSTTVSTNATSTATPTPKDYTITVVKSDVPNYSNANVSSDTIIKFLPKSAPHGISFMQGQDNKKHVFVFSSDVNSVDAFPAFQLTETTPNKFTFVKFYDDVKLGAVRASTTIQTKNTNNMVIVNHGNEVGPQKDWPLGDVWLIENKNSNFEFKKISSYKAFYYSVDTGDLNGDKAEDILVSNMEIKDSPSPFTIQSFLQHEDGSFYQQPSLAKETLNLNPTNAGSGSVGVADLDNDGQSEIIHANFTRNEQDWGAFRILQKNYLGEFKIVRTVPRTGNFNVMGALQVVPFDYDNDKDIDLLFTLEGSCNNQGGTFDCMAFELYRNDGNFVFTQLTDTIFNKSKIPTSEMVWAGIEIIDINKDGFLDIYLEYGGPLHKISSNVIDLGKYVIKNDNGKNFTYLSGHKDLQISFSNLNAVPTLLRTLNQTNNSTTFFGFDSNGAPTTVEISKGM
jgi:hypothetical protein